jgi:YVTN family beta-propeller protein
MRAMSPIARAAGACLLAAALLLAPAAEAKKRKKARPSPTRPVLLDSAHHGLAMNPTGTKLCVAGTMSDYAAIVNRLTFRYTIAAEGAKPYWSTNSGDGRYCFVAFSGDDNVGVISYKTNKLVTKIPVGDHPQRMRMGVIRKEFVS